MENIPIGILGLLAIIGVFFLCRELMCWYWKINKSIENQETIIALLRQLVENSNNKTNAENK